MAKRPDWMYGSRLPGVDISQLPGWKLMQEPEPQPQEEKEPENEDDNSKERD